MLTQKPEGFLCRLLLPHSRNKAKTGKSANMSSDARARAQMLLHINIYKAHKDPGKAQFCFNSENVSNSAPLSYEALGRWDLVEDTVFGGKDGSPSFVLGTAFHRCGIVVFKDFPKKPGKSVKKGEAKFQSGQRMCILRRHTRGQRICTREVTHTCSEDVHPEASHMRSGDVHP